MGREQVKVVILDLLFVILQMNSFNKAFLPRGGLHIMLRDEGSEGETRIGT